MKVRVIRNSFEGCPPKLRTSGFSVQTVLHVKISSELEVHAISIFSGVTFFLIVDDFAMLTWLPAWLFEAIDREIPRNWIASPFNDNPSLVIGPKLIAENLDAYSRFVEQEPELVSAMLELIRASRDA